MFDSDPEKPNAQLNKYQMYLDPEYHYISG